MIPTCVEVVRGCQMRCVCVEAVEVGRHKVWRDAEEVCVWRGVWT